MNKVADASRALTISEIQLESVGISALQNMYADDNDFKDIYQACTNLDDRYNHEYSDFLIQGGLLFKGGQLCIPKC